MTFTVRWLTLLAVISFGGACSNFHSLRPKAMGRGDGTSSSAPLPAGALWPSPNLLVGRVLAVDVARGFAFVELATDAPAVALSEGAALVARTDALRETCRLQASRYLRGRTLGTKILSGQPAPGDEVVFPAP